MARVPFSWRTRLGVPLSFFFFSRVVLLYLHSTYQLSLFTFSLSKTPKRRTQKVSLSLGPRDFILPRPVCSRPPDLVTSKNPPCSKEKQNITSRRPRRCARTPEIFSNHPSRGRSDLRVLCSCQSYESKKMRDLCPGTTYPDWPSVAWSIFIILGDLANINGVHPL